MQKLGVDGYVPFAVLAGDGCCVGDVTAVDLCAFVCSFVELLPTGPLWDTAKTKALVTFTQGGDYDTCAACYSEKSCTTMVDYAIYAARVLHHAITNILAPAINEASPLTAVATVGDWLERYGWQDCYRNACRVTPEAVGPYEYLDECGPVFCDRAFPATYEATLQRQILLALHRARRSGVYNLASLNWIAEPLGAVLTPRNVPEVPADCASCGNVQLEICATGDRFAGISATRTFNCGGVPRTVYPGVLAAACILQGLLPKKCPQIIFPC
jgi:hypothetical protein